MSCIILFVSARATHDVWCFSLGYCLTGKGDGQMSVKGGALPLGVKPVRLGLALRRCPCHDMLFCRIL